MMCSHNIPLTFEYTRVSKFSLFVYVPSLGFSRSLHDVADDDIKYRQKEWVENSVTNRLVNKRARVYGCSVFMVGYFEKLRNHEKARDFL